MCSVTISRRTPPLLLVAMVMFVTWAVYSGWRMIVPGPEGFIENTRNSEAQQASSYLERYWQSDQKSLDQPAVTGPCTKLLLVTHYRGGSTFLGDLFGHSENCFYWFEPLRAFMKTFNFLGTNVDASIIENTFYKLPDGTLKPLEEKHTQIRVDTLTQVMNCDVFGVDPLVLDDTIASAFHSPRAWNYSRCLKGKLDMDTCRSMLEEACSSAALTVAKTVRTPFYLVPSLLEATPDLRVIYYTRDPRAIANSRLDMMPRTPTSKVVEDTRNLCLRMAYDHGSYMETMAAYPGRVLHVVYEDLALNPVGVTNEMYRFLGLELPDAIRSWISENTNAADSSKKGMSTHKNSTMTAARWRTNLDPELQEAITAECQDTLKLFGYL